MRILWLVNVAPAEAVAALGRASEQPYGGWIQELSGALTGCGVELHVGFPWPTEACVRGPSGVRYVALKAARRKLAWHVPRRSIDKCVNAVRPDVIHLHGTEAPHAGLAAEVANRYQVPLLVQLQGIVSELAGRVGAGLTPWERHRPTLRSLLMGDTPHGLRGKYERLIEGEAVAIRNAAIVCGRTSWDKAISKSIAPSTPYYHAGELLRGAFWKSRPWQRARCVPHAILMSQGSYPIKGLHFALEGLSLLLREFPDAQLRILGTSLAPTGFRSAALRSSYAATIQSRIRRLGLGDTVQFLGRQSAELVANQLLDAHTFLSPSTLENSSNGIAESQLVGTPVVASDVGGTPDMVAHGQSGWLYAFDDPGELAAAVRDVWLRPDVASVVSARAREEARARHDPQNVVPRYLEVYRSLIHG